MPVNVAVILLKLFTDKTTYVFFNKQAHAYGGENPLSRTCGMLQMWGSISVWESPSPSQQGCTKVYH